MLNITYKNTQLELFDIKVNAVVEREHWELNGDMSHGY